MPNRHNRLQGRSRRRLAPPCMRPSDDGISYAVMAGSAESYFGAFGIFLISGLIRMAAASVLLRKFEEVRAVEPIRHRVLLLMVGLARPLRWGPRARPTGWEK